MVIGNSAAWPIGDELPIEIQDTHSSQPTVVGLSDGRFLVIWKSALYLEKIEAQIFDATGNPVGDTFSVGSTTLANNKNPGSGTSVDTGRFVLTWEMWTGSGWDLKAQIFEADGGKVGGEILVNTTTGGFWSQTASTISSLSGGRFVVTWTDWSEGGDDTSGSSIRALVFEADGSRSGTEFLVNTTTSNNQSETSIATLSDGRFVISWTDSSSTGGDTSGSAIRAQIFESDGTRSGSEFLVNTTISNGQSESSIAALSDGRFAISWTDSSITGGDTSFSAIRAQLFEPDGSKSGGEFLINTNTEYYQMDSAIAASSDGGFVISWSDLSAIGDDTSWAAIKAQRFSADGNKMGAEFLVNTTTAGSQAWSTVAPLEDGRIVIAYADDYSDGFALPAKLVVGYIRAQLFYLREPGGVDWTGTPFGDTYEGTEFDDWISGEAGDDTLSGLGGNDWIIGGDDNDYLYGDAGDDLLEGELGFDHLFGGAGNDFLDGGDDFDFVRYDQEHLDGGFAGVLVNLADGLGIDTFANTDTLSSVEGVVGSAFGDKITGGNSANGLYGLAGKDIISGAAGDDWLVGGDGKDKLDGGSGFDFAEYDIDHDSGGSEGISADLKAGTVVDTFGKTDALTSIEGIYGSIFKDSIKGDNKDNSLYGYVGNDKISGGGGNDYIFGGAGKDKLNGDDGWDYARYDADHFDGGYQGIVANLKTGEVIDSFGKLDILKNFEGIVGSYYGDKIIGDNSSNGLYGYSGDDNLKGNGGDDGLIGDDGDDALNAGDGNDYLWGDAGNDRLLGKDGKDKLYGGDENDTLIGGDGKDKLWGEAGSDVFVFDDNSGNDKIFDFDAFDALEIIDLSAVSKIKSFSDLISNHLEQDGGDCIIDDGKGNVITLVDVLISDLDASDFMF